jgi:hypothetical protein
MLRAMRLCLASAPVRTLKPSAGPLRLWRAYSGFIHLLGASLIPTTLVADTRVGSPPDDDLIQDPKLEEVCDGGGSWGSEDFSAADLRRAARDYRGTRWPGRRRRACHAHCSIRRDGIPPRRSPSPPTSPSCSFPPNAPSSIRLKTSGGSCARTGSPPQLQLLRRHRRSLLLRMEQAHRPTMAHYVPRTAPIGSSILSNARWY